MKSFQVLFVAIIVMCAGSFARGQTTKSDESTGPATRASMDVIEHVQHQLKDVSSVEADFVEKKNLAMLKHTLTIKGHLALQKPDRLIWIVREPVKYAVRIVGDEVRQWDEDTNHVEVIHLGGDPTFKAISQQMQAWFLGNYKDLGDSYEVLLLSREPLSLSFVPKASQMVAKIITSVDLTFNKDVVYIDTMVVRETGGDTTTIRFLNPKVNQAIAGEAWEMPPKEAAPNER
jgi:outer membrane lipoprotein-sorting protein